MEKCLAFVLGGGGAHDAMQVGALKALFEAGFKPDIARGHLRSGRPMQPAWRYGVLTWLELKRWSKFIKKWRMLI